MVRTVKRVELRHRANFVEIAETSPDIWPFFEFSKWRRHLAFLKLQIFNGRNGLEGQTASSCQISSKSLKLREAEI